MTGTDRRTDISRGVIHDIREGDVFFNRRRNETVVVVEILDARYVRVVDKENPPKSRLWRLTYLASSACDLQPHASPDMEAVTAWKTQQQQ